MYHFKYIIKSVVDDVNGAVFFEAYDMDKKKILDLNSPYRKEYADEDKLKLFGNKLVISKHYSTQTFLYDISTNKITELPYTFFCLAEGRNNHLNACTVRIKGDDEVYGVFDMEAVSFTKTIVDEELPNGIWRLNEKYILSRGFKEYFPNKECLLVYDYNLNLIWQSEDLSEIGRYEGLSKEKPGEIKCIQIYDTNKVIVGAGSVMICYDLDSGRKNWQLKIDQKNSRVKRFGAQLIIDGNIGYNCGDGYYYHKIDLAYGKFISDSVILNEIIVDGQSLAMYNEEACNFVLYAGFLWLSFSNSAVCMLLAINPETGEYVWQKRFEGMRWISEPQFHADKMFILSNEGLLIHERV